MANRVLVNEDSLKDIAAAIKEQTGDYETSYTPGEMGYAIRNIKTGASFSPDGVSIILNDDNTISTAIGGGMNGEEVQCINGEFIPVDGETIYLDEETGLICANIPESSGGGAVSIDNKTIVTNEAGELKTAIGGFIGDNPNITWTHQFGSFTVASYSSSYRLCESNGPTRVPFVEYSVGGVVHRATFNDYNATGYYDFGAPLSDTGGHIRKLTRYGGGQLDINVNAGPVTFDYLKVTTDKFTLVETIDANVIPIDNKTIVVNNGVLKFGYNNLKDADANYVGSVVGAHSSNKVGENYSFAFGQGAYTGSGTCCIAMGNGARTGNYHSAFATGYNTNAAGMASFAEGYYTQASGSYQHAMGKYNTIDSAGTYAQIVGNGSNTSTATRGNAYTLDWSGNAVFAGTVGGAGADYAEYFEWLDGNPEAEDRVGYLVALEGSNIRFAQPEDDVLGIVSGTAMVLGDDAEWNWQGKYLKDDFGRMIVDMAEEFTEVNGEQISVGFFPKPRLNPDYNPEEDYVSRAKRAEWETVGLMGKMYVRDNGTCVVGGYATPGADGIAIAATTKTNMRVMERVNENIIRVLMK